VLELVLAIDNFLATSKTRRERRFAPILSWRLLLELLG
jgi:hypothetical protein